MGTSIRSRRYPSHRPRRHRAGHRHPRLRAGHRRLHLRAGHRRLHHRHQLLHLLLQRRVLRRRQLLPQGTITCMKRHAYRSHLRHFQKLPDTITLRPMSLLPFHLPLLGHLHHLHQLLQEGHRLLHLNLPYIFLHQQLEDRPHHHLHRLHRHQPPGVHLLHPHLRQLDLLYHQELLHIITPPLQ